MNGSPLHACGFGSKRIHQKDMRCWGTKFPFANSFWGYLNLEPYSSDESMLFCTSRVMEEQLRCYQPAFQYDRWHRGFSTYAAVYR